MSSTIETESSASPTVPRRALRWWPAAVLLLAMVGVRYLPSLWEAPSLPILMFGFMGPAGVGLLILVWWCVASRASWKEKVSGLAGFILIAAIAISLVHFSMRGMNVVISVLPTGIALFAIGLILFFKSPNWRVPVALLLSLIGFGYWDLRQSEGVTGQFEPQMLWRWQPTAEQTYLQDLAARSGSGASSSNYDPVTLASAQWPAFRGPDRTGVVTGVVVDQDWKATPPKPIWRTKIGPGWSSFTVAGNRIFTQEQRGDDEAVVCLDADTGKIVWDFAYPSRFWEAIGGAGPRATPTIADEGLFAMGADGILVCLDANNGTERWRGDLKIDANRTPPMWGFSSSPLVTDSLVIVHAGGEGDKGLLAYSAADGELAWSVPSGDHTYSSAQLATFDETRGVLMMTNDGLQFVQVDDGSEIWRYDWLFENYRALQPLVIDGSVLIATSLGEGVRRITPTQNDDGKWEVNEDWSTRDMKPDFNDYVFYDGYVYGFDGSVFACIDAATGKRQWKRGRYGNGQVILLAEQGQLLIATEKGQLTLVNATPDRLDEVASIEVIEGKTWNHPVLVGNRVYMRNAQEAACMELPISVN